MLAYTKTRGKRGKDYHQSLDIFPFLILDKDRIFTNHGSLRGLNKLGAAPIYTPKDIYLRSDSCLLLKSLLRSPCNDHSASEKFVQHYRRTHFQTSVLIFSSEEELRQWPVYESAPRPGYHR